MLRYQVDDMSCGHCVQAITVAVKGVDPAAEIDIDLQTKLLEVATAATGSAVREAIGNAGYTPVEAGEAGPVAKPSCCGGRR